MWSSGKAINTATSQGHTNIQLVKKAWHKVLEGKWDLSWISYKVWHLSILEGKEEILQVKEKPAWKHGMVWMLSCLVGDTLLKLNIQKTKIMASSPITSWQIDGETMETVRDFILGGSKITADGDCSREIKRHLLLGRKVMTNLDSILKSRDITLPKKIQLVKVMVFPVVMYGCKSWAINKAERQRSDAFELWC